MAEPLLANYFHLQDECANILAYDSSNSITNEHITRLPFTSIAPFQPSPTWSEGHDANPSMNLMQPIISSSQPSNDQQTRRPTGESIGLPRLQAKSPMAMQRERTAKMDLKDLKSYMHLTEVEAAERLGVCTSVLKKIRRSSGLPRWPYRKIRSIDRSIATLEQSLKEDNDPRMKDDILCKIARLRKDKELACQGNNSVPTGPNDGPNEIGPAQPRPPCNFNNPPTEAQPMIRRRNETSTSDSPLAS